MDIVSHGLYAGAPFFNKSRKSYWRAFFWGIFPDLVSFGLFTPFFIYKYGFGMNRFRELEPPAIDLIPQYVHQLYNFTHSLIIFLAVFGLIWFLIKRPVYEMLGWGLHILIDIPTHNGQFFPTHFLYPFSERYFNGISWGTPWFFFSYAGLLAAIYAFLFFRKIYKKRKS